MHDRQGSPVGLSQSTCWAAVSSRRPPPRSHGKRPGPETCYILVKGCVDQGRPDLGELLIQVG